MNDLILTECYLKAKESLKNLRELQDLELIRKEWEKIASAALNAGYRCNDIKFGIPK